MRRGTKRSRTSVAKGKGLTAAGETFHHSVYVILLDSGASASIDPAFEPKARSGEAMRLRRHDRIVGPGSLRQSQERTKIGMGRKKVRSPLDARAVRIFKSDALRSSSPNGKGFGRRSASGGLYGRRWYLAGPQSRSISLQTFVHQIGGADSAIVPDTGTFFGLVHARTDRTSSQGGCQEARACPADNRVAAAFRPHAARK
jgi:hypothetical protein